MSREDNHKVILMKLNLDSEKCTLVQVSDRIIRIYFDDKLREADVTRYKYRIEEYCDVTEYSHYTIDLIKKRSLHSLISA